MNVPAHVQAKIKRYDRELQVRWAGDCWALERKGVRIGTVRADLLGDGSMLLNKLHANDLWKQGGREVGKNAERIGADIDYNEAWEERKRKENRKQEWVDKAKEDHDTLKLKLGSRIFNAGMPQ
jgi:hypothetical protein